VVVLCPDLLFGSRVEGGLRAAGHQVRRLDRADEVQAELAERGADVLVVDLTEDAARRADALGSMSAAGVLDGVRTLAFYSHVDQHTRLRAEQTGFDLVVPRSRMAREMGALVQRLLARAQF
jgi:DNA-binding response OmpR family regulator